MENISWTEKWIEIWFENSIVFILNVLEKNRNQELRHDMVSALSPTLRKFPSVLTDYRIEWGLFPHTKYEASNNQCSCLATIFIQITMQIV